MSNVNDIHRQNTRAADAKKYRGASIRLQELLTHPPLEVAQVLDRICPFCLNYMIPRIVEVKIAGHQTRRQAIFPDRCGCLKEQAAIVDEAERRNKTLDRDAQISWRSSLQRAGLIGWLARATFDTYRERDDFSDAAQVKGDVEVYAEAVIKRKLGEKPWLVLYGAYGCGKSHLAAAVCHEMLRRNLDRVYFRPWNEYINRLLASFDRSPHQERTQTIIDELQSGRLVVIDDLDKVPQSKSGWIEGQLFTVLNHRYNARLPTVITLNASPDTLAGPIGDRLRGAAFDSILFDGPSFRGR